jgi:hypothetical protein
MAKKTGLTCKVSVDDSGTTLRDISNDVLSVDISTPRAMIDATGVDKSAMERLVGLADAQVTINGQFNDAADQSHDVFRTVSSSDVARTVELDYVTTGTSVLSMEMLFSDYAVARSADGNLTWTATGQLSDGTVPTWTT